MNDVSVILVNYNTKELTKNCICSIYSKTSNIKFDLWLVDNNSTDGTCEMIASEFPEVKIIKNDKNLGFGISNNLAIKKCNAKYVFLLNTDTILINNAIKILFDFMEQNLEIGACGGNLYNANMENVLSYGWFPSIKRKFLSIFLLDKFILEKNHRDNGKNKNNSYREVDYVTGADLMIRKKILDKVGYFDKDFFLYFDEDFFLYFEDTELQYRIKKASHKIYINPESKIFHLENKSCNNRKERRKIILKSEYLFFKKRYNLSKYSFIKILFFISHLTRFVVNPKMIFQVWRYICKT